MNPSTTSTTSAARATATATSSSDLEYYSNLQDSFPIAGQTPFGLPECSDSSIYNCSVNSAKAAATLCLATTTEACDYFICGTSEKNEFKCSLFSGADKSLDFTSNLPSPNPYIGAPDIYIKFGNEFNINGVHLKARNIYYSGSGYYEYRGAWNHKYWIPRIVGISVSFLILLVAIFFAIRYYRQRRLARRQVPAVVVTGVYDEKKHAQEDNRHDLEAARPAK
ncbi:hypothetical protein HDU97_008157 [Phlyctochytrium planicorne]|nr:hypothetical protein HDU97_008157 [Phlyctochytrium planicorne]